MSETNLTGFFEKNCSEVEEKIDSTMKILAQSYRLNQRKCPSFSCLNIQGMECHIRQYEIESVGNLLIMDTKDSKAVQMATIVLTPYFKNLPVLSYDFMYIQGKRNIIFEIYDLVETKNETYMTYLEQLQEVLDRHQNGFIDIPSKEEWYDEWRPVHFSKGALPEQDEEIQKLFTESLCKWMEMEHQTELLSKEQLYGKWEKTKTFVDKMVSNGGVSTNMFKAVLGEEKVKEFFDQVFFAPELYVPERK